MSFSSPQGKWLKVLQNTFIKGLSVQPGLEFQWGLMVSKEIPWRDTLTAGLCFQVMDRGSWCAVDQQLQPRSLVTLQIHFWNVGIFLLIPVCVCIIWFNFRELDAQSYNTPVVNLNLPNQILITHCWLHFWILTLLLLCLSGFLLFVAKYLLWINTSVCINLFDGNFQALHRVCFDQVLCSIWTSSPCSVSAVLGQDRIGERTCYKKQFLSGDDYWRLEYGGGGGRRRRRTVFQPLCYF